MSAYYISKKSFSVWISLAFALISLFAGVNYYFSAPTGSSIIHITGIAGLPVAAIFFVFSIIFLGKKKFSFTILPVVLGCISFVVAAVGKSIAAVIICRVFCIATAIIYVAVIFNKIKTNTLLVYLFGVAVLCSAIVIFKIKDQLGMQDISAFCALVSMLFISLGMRRDYEGFTFRWNDRANARQVRSLPPMSKITPYFMPDRIGAQNLIREQLNLTEIEKYIAEKRKQGLKGFGFMHVFIASYLRAVAQYPGVNRYLSGQKIYSRTDCEVAFVVKKEMTAEAPDTVVKIKFKPGITAEEVYHQVTKVVGENKGEAEDSVFDTVAKMFSYVPGVFLKFTVWFIKLLDYFGLLPTALEEVSPFHASMFFTSVASIGIPVIFHHLYNFGNVPIFCAFGKKYKKSETDKDGNIVTEKYIDYTFSADERICDGYYFSLVLRHIRKIFSNPYCLDIAEEPLKDIL